MQEIGKQRLSKTIGMAFMAVGIQSAAHAVDVGDRLEINGYGHQDYLKTTANTYLGADTNGTWNSNALSLVFTAKIDGKSKVVAQLNNNSMTEKTRGSFKFRVA